MSQHLSIDALLAKRPQCPDSLALLRLAHAISEIVEAEVPLRALYECSDATELLTFISSADLSQGTQSERRPPNEADPRCSTVSFAQERMAFMGGLSAGSAAYHAAFGLWLEGKLNQDSLCWALENLPSRHPSLQFRYLPSESGVSAIARSGARIPLKIHEARNLTDQSMLAIASEFCNAPFAIDKGILARSLLLSGAPEKNLLVLAFHHIAIDLWSYEQLLQTLWTLYEEHLTGRHVGVQRNAISRDASYAAWHRAWFRQQAFERSRDFWHRRLDGADRTTLPPDFARPARPSYRGARVALTLPDTAWQEMEQLGASENASLAMVLHAALTYLLHAYTDTQDISIGLATANRQHVSSENFSGTLVNTLVLRVALAPQKSFRSLLAIVRQLFLESFDQEDLPFETLVRLLNAPRDPAFTPLFGVMLNMQNTPATCIDPADLRVRRVEIDRQSSQFDLTLTVDRLHTKTIYFEYATDLYKKETIQRVAAHFEWYLKQFSSAPDRPLSDCSMLLEAERTLLSHIACGPSLEQRARGISRPVWEVATTDPERQAVVQGEASLTYRQLEAEIQDLVAQLQLLGIERGSIVGLTLTRSVRLPAFLLACLRAGVSYVPMDAGFPHDRLAWMASDSAIGWLLTDDPDMDRPVWLPAGAKLIRLDSRPMATADWVTPSTIEEGVAYVLYTSGSTGRPKGVVIPCSALIAFLAAMQVRPGFSAVDRLLAVTTLSFDISLLELLLPLTCGGAVCIATREESSDGFALAKLLKEQSISVLQATPSTWFQLINSDWSGQPGLRAFVGGEMLPRALAQKLGSRVDELWNLYGPTETTVWSACKKVDDEATSVIPVGNPISGTEIRVLGHEGQEMGIGMVGQIHIAGEGVASRYLNQPELTAQRFLTRSISGETRRYYATGDRGRWRADGELECLGRIDSQVKIRGHRIELEEIEAVAGELPWVRQAIVVSSASALDDVRLAVYCVTEEAERFSPDDVRAFLRKRLPEYMVPQWVAVVADLPKLPNGKIDLQRLSADASLNSNPSTARGEPPKTQLELKLAALWAELLGSEVKDRQQNFFESGGHSLLAMRLVNRIREDLLLQCSLAQVFAHPTLASMSESLSGTPTLNQLALVPLASDGPGPAIYCLHGVHIYRALARELDGKHPVIGLYVPLQALHPPAETSNLIARLASEYASAIREHQPEGPYSLLGFSMGGVIAMEVARNLSSDGCSAVKLLILDSDVPGDVSRSTLGTLRHWLQGMLRPSIPKESGQDYEAAIREHDTATYAGSACLIETTKSGAPGLAAGWNRLVRNMTRVKVACTHDELLRPPHVSAVRQAVLAEHSTQG